MEHSNFGLFHDIVYIKIFWIPSKPDMLTLLVNGLGWSFWKEGLKVLNFGMDGRWS